MNERFLLEEEPVGVTLTEAERLKIFEAVIGDVIAQVVVLLVANHPDAIPSKISRSVVAKLAVFVPMLRERLTAQSPKRRTIFDAVHGKALLG